MAEPSEIYCRHLRLIRWHWAATAVLIPAVVLCMTLGAPNWTQFPIVGAYFLFLVCCPRPPTGMHWAGWPNALLHFAVYLGVASYIALVAWKESREWSFYTGIGAIVLSVGCGLWAKCRADCEYLRRMR
jgi:hypothetical protein